MRRSLLAGALALAACAASDDRPRTWAYLYPAVVAPSCATATCHSALAARAGIVIDRLMHGHVVDFIQWHVGQHYWPAFNIADCAVVGGAIGIGLFGLLSGKPKPEAG